LGCWSNNLTNSHLSSLVDAMCTGARRDRSRAFTSIWGWSNRAFVHIQNKDGISWNTHKPEFF
jgi:hypothetical protein